MYYNFPDANILRIDLSMKIVTREKLPGDIYRKYPGGSSLGLYYATNEIKKGIDPLSEGNVLVFSVSPLTGLPISGISRVNVTAKSPLTGTIGDSQAGGFFPAHLKMNGIDAIVITGKSPKPVYLYIHDEHCEIKDAKHIWGKVTGETEELIRKELEVPVEIAEIGPAGENLVKYACIMNMSNRANGRNGLGAVMGSKGLKAIAVAKNKPQEPCKPELFKQLTKQVVQNLKENDAVSGLGKYGTDGDLEDFSKDGFLPTFNWNSGYFPEGANSITGTTMYDSILKERDTCFACAVRCKRVVEIENLVDPLYGGPEYETTATFGSYCGISSLEHIALANQLCNMYGLDTISAGATIAFAMNCFEEGLFNIDLTDGLELNFGNKHVLEPLLKKISFREGFGNLLAEGSFRVAESLGKDAIDLTVTVKKQELPAHMPQYKPALGLIYAVNPFGADHQSSEHDVFLVMPEDSREVKRLKKLGVHKTYDNPFEMDDDKTRFAFETQKYFSTLDSLCLCQFVWGPSWELCGPEELLKLLEYGIGWESSMYELLQIGERRINMMRAFNAREGFTKADDQLPKKIFQPLKNGPSEGMILDEIAHERAKRHYYAIAGWDAVYGNPTSDTLRKLNLDWLI